MLKNCMLEIAKFIATCKVWQRDTVKLGLINYQKDNMQTYLLPLISALKVDTSNNQLLVNVRWFNGTVFDVQIDSTIGGGEIAGLGIPHNTHGIKKTCGAGRFHECALHLSVSSDVLKAVDEASKASVGIPIHMTLEWQMYASEIDTRFSIQGPHGPCYVVPQRT